LDEIRVASIIGDFYEAVLDSQRWPVAMQKLADFAGAQGVNWMSGSIQRVEGTILQQVGNPPDSIEAYHARYSALDPIAPALASAQVNSWVNDWRDCGFGYPRSTYYNEFIRRFELETVMAVKLFCEGDYVASVSLQRRKGQPHFSIADEDRLRPLVPHMGRAARLLRETEALRAQTSIAARALDHAGFAIWVVDQSGKVLLANREAATLTSANQGWRLAFGHLRRSKQDDAFAKALSAATSSAGPRASWLVAGTLDGEQQPFLVAPLAAASPLCGDFQRPLAVVLGTANDTGGRMAMKALRVLYGLTNAEARAAALVGTGRSPMEVADALGLSVATVRVQLRSVFLKTGIRRQADLVLLVQSLDKSRH